MPKITNNSKVNKGDIVKLAKDIYFSEKCHIGPGISPSACLFSLDDVCRARRGIYQGDFLVHWEKGDKLRANESGRFEDVTWEDGERIEEPYWFDQEYGIKSSK